MRRVSAVGAPRLGDEPECSAGRVDETPRSASMAMAPRVIARSIRSGTSPARRLINRSELTVEAMFIAGGRRVLTTIRRRLIEPESSSFQPVVAFYPARARWPC